jgi:dTDP-4-dehydrorhamnose 3,5-epimerase
MSDIEQASKIETLTGFYELVFPIFSDSRGFFRTWYSDTSINLLGIKFKAMQSNISRSKKGAVRGIHFSDPSYEQSKIITCIQGVIADVSVDLRKDSVSFGKHSEIILSAEAGNSAFISHGLGHAFEVLSEEATVVYLLSSEWNPKLEYQIYPLDSDLDIHWSTKEPIISDKDRNGQAFRDFNNLLK